MSYQIPPQNPSSPNHYTDVNNVYEYQYQEDDQEVMEHVLSNTGFKRTVFSQESRGGSAEKSWNNELNKSRSDGSPRSSDLIVQVSEMPAYMGMSYSGVDEGGLFNLRSIINEAKKSDGRLPKAADNYPDIYHNNMNIRIEDDGYGAELPEDKGRFNRGPTKVRKTDNQAVEIDFTEDYYEKEEGGHYGDPDQELKVALGGNEGLNHSKSSYLSGPVRYSKMPEEEAATIFEQRRKELLGNLVKKERRKHLRIFQDQDANTARATDLNSTSTKAKAASPPGFVIYNNARTPSLNKPRLESPPPFKKIEEKQSASQLRKSTATTRPVKTRAGSSIANTEKRENISQVLPQQNKVNSLPKTKSTEQPQVVMKKPAVAVVRVPIQLKPTAAKKEEPNKIFVGRDALKGSRMKEKKSITEEVLVLEEHKGSQRETPFRYQEIASAQESVEFKEVMVSNIQSPSQSYSSTMQPQKNQNIWADIESLDHQIQELQEDSGPRRNNNNNNNNHNKPQQQVQSQSGWKKTKKEKTNDWGNEYPLIKEESETESIDHKDQVANKHRMQFNETWSRNEEKFESHASERRTSDRYKLTTEDLLIESETENVYSRYPMRNEELGRTNSFISQPQANEEINKDPYSQSCRGFNVKKGPQRHEMLYQRALEQKETRQMQHEISKREKAVAEMSECTFAPLFRTKSIETTDDFNTRAKNWQQSKERKIEEYEKKKSLKEMEECTFQPKGSLKRGEPTKFDANEFYQRNMEWKQKLENEELRKQDEYLKLVTLSSEKSKPQRSTEHSVIMKSQTQTVIPQRASAKKIEIPISGRSVIKKGSLEEKQLKEKQKAPVQNQRSEDAGTKKPLFQKTQNHRMNILEEDFLKKFENPKGSHPDFNETTELFDILRRVVTNKSEKSDGIRSKGTSQSPHKRGMNETVKVTSQKTIKQNEPQLAFSATMNTLESTVFTNKSKSGSNDVPFLCTDVNAKELKSNAENITIKNNKYYITKKLKSPSNQRITQETSKEDIPLQTYSLPSRIKSGPNQNTSNSNSNINKETTGKYMRGFSPRRDQENTTSPKFFVEKQQTLKTPPDLFEDYYTLDESKQERVPLGSKQFNQSVESPKAQNGYGKKVENKDLPLEKRFLDLISQVGRVTQQLDNIRPQAATPQNESLSAKRRRINFSLH